MSKNFDTQKNKEKIVDNSSLSYDDMYNQLGEKAWEIILSSITSLRDNKYTLEEIAQKIDVKNRSLISEWLSGNRAPSRTAFVNIIKYLDLLDYSIQGTEIHKKEDLKEGSKVYKNNESEEKINELKDEIKKLKKENSKLKEKLEVIKEITGKKKKK